MTADAERNALPPEPPSFSFFLAVLLELGIVATFAAQRSLVGLLLCACYAWFSACWAFAAGRW